MKQSKEYQKKQMRDKEAAKLHAEQEQQKELEALLRRSVKHLDLDATAIKRGLFDVMKLPPQRQIVILEKYIVQLEKEMKYFQATWGNDSAVDHALGWFRVERSDALDQIARLKIEAAKPKPTGQEDIDRWKR
jgi:hypothetical protein